MKDDDVRSYVQGRLPNFTPVGEPVRLPEGNLNVVWRVPGDERTLIVKYAPPYIAANPEVPLDPSRLTIEARCLAALGSEGSLADVSRASVRTPRPFDVNEEDHVLIMEDLGDLPTLGRWLREADVGVVQDTAGTLGRRLGAFIGDLHAATHGDDRYAAPFDNRPMQETRFAVQYQGVTDMLERGGVSDAGELGARAEALGEALLKPGSCLTMGDLWPRSVLVADDMLYLIDWELAHYGRPLQDVAHWLAHLWMQEHRAPSADVADALDDLRRAFLAAYRDALGDVGDALWTERERRDAAIHFGAEILVRAVGPFQSGYVYGGLNPNHFAVQAAVHTAARFLRAPETANVLTVEAKELP